MLWTIIVSFIIFWVLGLVSGYTMGDFIHIALVIAIIAILVQVDSDCSDFSPARARGNHSKRRGVGRSRKMLPPLAMLPGEKISQTIISPQSQREK